MPGSINTTRGDELIVGFYRKDSGKPSITWQQAVDEALCFGWIDGIRRKHSEIAYSNRFTPRRPKSNWSAINIGRVEELARFKRMQPAGLAAFAKRTKPARLYNYEQKDEQSSIGLEDLQGDQKAGVSAARRIPQRRTPGSTAPRRKPARLRRLDKLIAVARGAGPIQ